MLVRLDLAGYGTSLNITCGKWFARLAGYIRWIDRFLREPDVRFEAGGPSVWDPKQSLGLNGVPAYFLLPESQIAPARKQSPS